MRGELGLLCELEGGGGAVSLQSSSGGLPAPATTTTLPVRSMKPPAAEEMALSERAQKEVPFRDEFVVEVLHGGIARRILYLQHDTTHTTLWMFLLTGTHARQAVCEDEQASLAETESVRGKLVFNYINSLIKYSINTFINILYYVV